MKLNSHAHTFPCAPPFPLLLGKQIGVEAKDFSCFTQSSCAMMIQCQEIRPLILPALGDDRGPLPSIQLFALWKNCIMVQVGNNRKSPELFMLLRNTQTLKYDLFQITHPKVTYIRFNLNSAATPAKPFQIRKKTN
jgi:hypothetical protein